MPRKKKTADIQYDDVILGPDAEQAERRREDRELPVKLSDEAMQARRLALSSLAEQRMRLEDELKEVSAPLREDIKLNKQEQKKLAKIIAEGSEPAMVQCEVEQVFAQNAVVVRRLDTHEIVETRSMSGSERQLSIDDVLGEPDDEEGYDGGPDDVLQDGAP
jgi:hypothetical protein